MPHAGQYLPRLIVQEGRGMKSLRFAVIAASVACSSLVMAQSALSPDVQLKAAENRELVDRDVNGAMQDYQRIAQRFASDHVVAAEALLHLGGIYERLGRSEALATYQRIISNYPDVSAVVHVARTRLTALQDTAAGPFKVKVFDDRIDGVAPVLPSPDGRYLAYRRPGSTEGHGVGSWYIHDLTSGKESVLLASRVPGSNFDYLEWAPDGRHAAFFVQESSDVFDRGIVTVSDRDVRSVARVTRQPNEAVWLWADNFWWSPDGKRVALLKRGPGTGSYNVHVFTVASGGDLDAGPLGLGGIVWAPDGQHIAFLAPGPSQVASVRVVAPSTGAASEVSIPSPGPGQTTRLVAWTRANEIYFSQSVAGGNDLFLISVAGGAPHKVCEGRGPSGGDGCGGGLSPDGTIQIVRKNVSGGGRIMLRNLADGQERPLTPEAVWEEVAFDAPSFGGFSPDGKLFAFRSHRDSAYGLYVVPVDRIPVPNPVKIASLTSQATVVVGSWTTAGLLVGLKDALSNIYRIDIDPRTRRPAGAPIRLTQDSPVNRDPHISSDGQQIAYVSLTGLAVMQSNGTRERVIKEVPPDLLDTTRIAGWQSSDEALVWGPKLGTGNARLAPKYPGVLNVRTGDLRYQAAPLDADAWYVPPASRTSVHHPVGSDTAVLQTISGGAERTISLPHGWMHYTFSPDGRWLAYSTANLPNDRSKPVPGDIRLRSVDTGAEHVLVKWADSNNHKDPPLSFSPDGRLLAYQDPSDGLRVMDVTTTESWPLLVDPPKGVDFTWWREVQWSPDGSFVIVTGQSSTQTWRRYDGITYDVVTKLVTGKK